MKKYMILLGSLLIIVVAATFVSSEAQGNTDVIHHTLPPATPVGFQPPVVNKAASPHNLPYPRRTPGAYGARAVQPPVNEVAVRAYLAQGQGVPGMASEQAPQITSVEFWTVGDLDSRLGYQLLPYYEATGRIVYVTFAGRFPTDGAIHTQAHAVFDAETGNFLASGTRP